MKVMFTFDKVLRRLAGLRGWQLCSLVAVSFLLLLLLLSRSDQMCVNHPLLMRFRDDSCRIWKDSGLMDISDDLQWWQTVCSLERDWFDYNYQCRDLRLMGNWPVCFDGPTSPVKKGKPCIVYSFGIAYDFRFDDAFTYHNCTVYSFDPSMNVKDYRRPSGVNFKRIGIGAHDNDNFQPRLDGYAKSGDLWKIMKLSSIFKMLGHTADSISVLKMDVENNEWDILANLLEEDILQKLPQVLIEWHIFTDSPPVSRYQTMHHQYKQFKEMGFRNFWSRNEGRDHWLPKLHSQAETAYININYKPSGLGNSKH